MKRLAAAVSPMAVTLAIGVMLIAGPGRSQVVAPGGAFEVTPSIPNVPGRAVLQFRAVEYIGNNEVRFCKGYCPKGTYIYPMLWLNFFVVPGKRYKIDCKISGPVEVDYDVGFSGGSGGSGGTVSAKTGHVILKTNTAPGTTTTGQSPHAWITMSWSGRRNAGAKAAVFTGCKVAPS